MPLPALDLFHIDVLRLHDCASADHLHAAVTRLSESLGYPYFVYALREAGRFAQSPVHMLDGYPPGWVARYAHQDFYGADPVLRQASGAGQLVQQAGRDAAILAFNDMFFLIGIIASLAFAAILAKWIYNRRRGINPLAKELEALASIMGGAKE